MDTEYLQTVKIALILCSCFFAYGTYWSDWAFDYYLLWANPHEKPQAVEQAVLYYANQLQIPTILKYVPIINLAIAAAGFATGLFVMADVNLLFDGASMVLLFFGVFTHVTTVKPAVLIANEAENDIGTITVALKNIAAAHFIIVLAITGIIGLQITHYFVVKRSSRDGEDDDVNFDEDVDGDEDEDEEDKNIEDIRRERKKN